MPGDGPGGKVSSGQADVGGNRDAGPAFGAGENGQFAIGFVVKAGKFPLFDSRGDSKIVGASLTDGQRANVSQKSGYVFVKKRKKILHFDKNIGIIGVLANCTKAEGPERMSRRMDGLCAYADLW